MNTKLIDLFQYDALDKGGMRNFIKTIENLEGQVFVASSGQVFMGYLTLPPRICFTIPRPIALKIWRNWITSESKNSWEMKCYFPTSSELMPAEWKEEDGAYLFVANIRGFVTRKCMRNTTSNLLKAIESIVRPGDSYQSDKNGRQRQVNPSR